MPGKTNGLGSDLKDSESEPGNHFTARSLSPSPAEGSAVPENYDKYTNTEGQI